MQPGLADEGQLTLHAGDEPIPGFRLVRRRGRGGFGEVWEAEASGGIHVALKFVRCSPRALASELRALKFVRSLHHPNILANFGSWQVEQTVIVGMELADGSLWDRYIEAANAGLRGIPRSELLGYMADAAAGVDFLNEPRHTVDGRGGMSVQHRDIKPPNILLFGGGAKVADLGMARAMEGEHAGHTGIWTFAYAAPEFFRGVTARQSDQYGLAATYCHLRCGRLPFEGTAATVTAGHMFGNPGLGDLPEAERPVLERALAKEPADRWPDCRAFVEALRTIAPEEAPELLPMPCETGENHPRMSCSTTGSAFAIDDAPPWRPFASGTGDTGDTGRDYFEETSEVPPPASGGSGPTAIMPAVSPETVEGPSAEPVEDPSAGFAEAMAFYEPRPRSRRPARYAASIVLVGLAIAAAGVHPLADHSRSPRTPPVPVPTPTPTPTPTPEPAPEPAPEPPPVSAPEPAVAIAAPVPALPRVVEAPDPPEVEARPSTEIEPAPAEAAEQIRPASPPTHEPDPPADAHAVRSDLVPGPRSRREATTGRESPAIVPPKPAEAATPERPESARDEAIRPASGDPGGLPTTPLDRPRADRATVAPTRPNLPEMAATAAARGRDHLAQGEFEPAIADFDELIRLCPGLASAYFYRAIVRHRASHYPEALADYSETIRLRPADAFAFIARGQAHHDLGAYDRAIADFTEAIRLRPDDTSARLRRGLARYRSDDFAGALVDFDETLRLDPKNLQARAFRSDTLARLGGRVRAETETQTDRANPPEVAPKSSLPATTTTPRK